MNVTLFVLFAVVSLLLPFMTLAIRWFAVRKGWVSPEPRFRSARAFRPASAPAACGVARIVEATVVGVAAAWILVFWHVLSNSATPSEHPMSGDIAFYCLVASAGIAVLATLLGRTTIGIIVLIVAIFPYSIIQITSARAFSPWDTSTVNQNVTYTIDLDGTNVEGADLWVNGVYLGKTPYTTTLSDFEAKAPY